MRRFRALHIVPAQVLDLSTWKINLPVNDLQVEQPLLNTFASDEFRAQVAVQFTAPCGGSVQPGSKYPRSELREMNVDGSVASWSTTTGRHVLEVTERVTHLPVVKPAVVTAQIHDADGAVLLIWVEGERITARYEGSDRATLDGRYVLGTYFVLKLLAADGYIDVYYNGSRVLHQADRRHGCYFKVGCYTQSSPSTGDARTAYGQVEVSALSVMHA